ncbi:MAG: hypothetical protein SF182_19955 [Deltaproteobacteria bacterium]|nr:hypothetical protein [Deltaproteobacteria bacterium]
MRLLARLALLGGGLLLALLALEGLARLAVPQWRGLVPQRFMTQTAAGVLAGVPHFDGRVASLWGDFDVALRLDARGFRNPPGATPDAPLAFVGDSFCQGWGVEADEAFPPRVAAALGLPSYNFCTVGADLRDDLRIVQTAMPPRVSGATVLTVTFENDVLAYPDLPADAASSSVEGLSRSRLSRWLMQHSALFDVATTLARQSPAIVAAVRRLGLVSGVPIAGGVDPIAASVRMIAQIRRAAGDGPFLVVLVPPRAGQVDFNDADAFVRAVRGAGVDVLDPREQPGLTITTIPHDGHWDAAMHAAVAPLVAERLRAAGVPQVAP